MNESQLQHGHLGFTISFDAIEKWAIDLSSLIRIFP